MQLYAISTIMPTTKGKVKVFVCMISEGENKGNYCLREEVKGAVVFKDPAPARLFVVDFKKAMGWQQPMGPEKITTNEKLLTKAD